MALLPLHLGGGVTLIPPQGGALSPRQLPWVTRGDVPDSRSFCRMTGTTGHQRDACDPLLGVRPSIIVFNDAVTSA